MMGVRQHATHDTDQRSCCGRVDRFVSGGGTALVSVSLRGGRCWGLSCDVDCAALFINQAAQSASVAASPFQWGHQIAWLISFLALPVLVGVTVLLLVVLPALDTLSAGQVGLCHLSCGLHLICLSNSPVCIWMC